MFFTLPLLGAMGCLASLHGAAATAQQLPGQQPPAAREATPRPAPPAVQGEEEVVAIVNKDPITKSELEASVKPHLAQHPNLDQATVQKVESQVLETLVESRLVEQHLLENGPKVPQEEVHAVTEQIKNQVRSQGASYREFLAERGQNEQTIAKRIEGSLAWSKFREQQVTQEELQRFYQQNQQQFQGQPYEQVQTQVHQMYLTGVWKGIAEQVRPTAEIEVLLPAEAPAGAQLQGVAPAQPQQQAPPQPEPQPQPQTQPQL